MSTPKKEGFFDFIPDSLAHKAGRMSAFLGLSSPLSGVKNFAIGSNMTIGIYGFRAYARGMAKVMNPWTTKDAYKQVRRTGGLQLGTKELEISGGWLKLSLMTQTEAINRVVSSFAADFTAREMVNSMRGGGGMWADFQGAERTARELKDLFNLIEDIDCYKQR